MPSARYRSLCSAIRVIEKTYMSFKPRPTGNYTRRQLSLAAAYTVFCHAEIETFMEEWATAFTDFADTKWGMKQASRPLVHLCAFHEGCKVLSTMPQKDVWNEPVVMAIKKHRGAISNNNGIKEGNVIKLLSPIGFDVRQIDQVLLADLSAFGQMRGDHVHKSISAHLGTVFDPFDRARKVTNLLKLLEDLDHQLAGYMAQC